MAVASRWALLAGALAASSLSSVSVRADGEPVRLSYQAHAGCPDGAAFFAEIAARTRLARQADRNELARPLRVLIENQAGFSRGTVEIGGRDGARTQREIEGDDCGEVSSALALIAALVIDPRASTSPLPPRNDADQPAVEARPQPAGSDPRAAPAAADPPSASREPAPPAAAEADARRDLESVENGDSWPHGPLEWGAGAEAVAMSVPAPEWAFGGGAFVDLASVSRRTLAPSFRVSAIVVGASVSFRDSVGGRFIWLLARSELCPVRPAISRAWRLEACAAFDAGILDTLGTGVDNPDHDTVPWFSAGGLARIVWSASSVAFIEASGGLAIPLRSYALSYAPAGPGDPVEVHEIPPISGDVSLGAGIRFR
jgi:hypothetical protein